MSKPSLEDLTESARNHVMTEEERRAQTISFAYGNLAIENPAITRGMVERAYDARVTRALDGPQDVSGMYGEEK